MTQQLPPLFTRTNKISTWTSKRFLSTRHTANCLVLPQKIQVLRKQLHCTKLWEWNRKRSPVRDFFLIVTKVSVGFILELCLSVLGLLKSGWIPDEIFSSTPLGLVFCLDGDFQPSWEKPQPGVKILFEPAHFWSCNAKSPLFLKGEKRRQGGWVNSNNRCIPTLSQLCPWKRYSDAFLDRIAVKRHWNCAWQLGESLQCALNPRLTWWSCRNNHGMDGMRCSLLASAAAAHTTQC